MKKNNKSKKNSERVKVLITILMSIFILLFMTLMLDAFTVLINLDILVVIFICMSMVILLIWIQFLLINKTEYDAEHKEALLKESIINKIKANSYQDSKFDYSTMIIKTKKAIDIIKSAK